MIQLVPQLKIFLAYQPVDFRKGIDGLVAVCKQQLLADPYDGCVFVFRNRSATSVKLLTYDSTGFWLCLKRLSRGRLRWWPKPTDQPLTRVAAQQLQVLLYNGNPDAAQMDQPWRKLS